MEQEEIILDRFIPQTNLVIASEGNFIFIPFDAIIRIKKKGIIVNVYTTTEQFTCSQTMEELMRELPVNKFARVSVSHIISIDHLHLLRKDKAMARIYRHELINKLSRILEQEYKVMSFRSAMTNT